MKLDTKAKYQESHEWARLDGDVVTVGISDHAQDQLNDVVYVELPEVGTEMPKGETFGVVESVKSASDLYMPVGGTISAVNDALEDSPELVNDDAFGEGWMIKISPSDPSELDSLLTADDYKSGVESGAIEN